MSAHAGAPSRGAVTVSVAAGTASRQALVTLVLPAGSRVADAVERSGVLARFPQRDRERLDYAVFGERVEPGRLLASGDRVEVLRALRVDPKEARRRRASRRASARGRC